MSQIGIIAIGRNEGERLRRCLQSIVGRGYVVVYVDSASTDKSVSVAQTLGAEVVRLDMSIPFSAARARNEGFARLEKLHPETEFVFMVDGDCEIIPDFIEKALVEMKKNDKLAVVCGRRRERFPDASIYNKLADVEWDTPIGPAQSCGGDALIRAGAFKQVQGYNASVVAGEEPEMCQRLRAAGWTILRINAEMTIHDSAMMHFSQWWKRAVRSGYGMMDVSTRFGQEGLFVQQTHSAKMWAWGYPLAILATLVIAPFFFRPVVAFLLVICVILILPLQMLRIAQRKMHLGIKVAMWYGFLTMIGKWAFASGQSQYAEDRKNGKIARLIDYKAA